MNIIDYLDNYKDKSFNEVPFNELDALALALIGYFPFSLIKEKKLTSSTISEFLKFYQPEQVSDRKLQDIVILNTLCNSKRYKKIRFFDFVKKKDGQSIEQFQAITIEFPNFLYISFCGTDASTLGWREDLNMSFLDMVPSEVDAISYANMVRKKHPFKDIYIGGHSKGGRLAVRAGKELYKKKNLKAVFSFDGPNFTDSFYDEKYEEVKSLIYEYAPNESIIGRLISDRPKIIIQSNAKSIYQHDAYTWQVDEDHFVHLDNYTARSNKIAKITKAAFEKFDYETKSIVVNTLFDVADKLNIHHLKPDEKVPALVMGILSTLRIEWKNIPKENRKIVSHFILSFILLVIQTKE